MSYFTISYIICILIAIICIVVVYKIYCSEINDKATLGGLLKEYLLLYVIFKSLFL